MHSPGLPLSSYNPALNTTPSVPQNLISAACPEATHGWSCPLNATARIGFPGVLSVPIREENDVKKRMHYPIKTRHFLSDNSENSDRYNLIIYGIFFSISGIVLHIQMFVNIYWRTHLGLGHGSYLSTPHKPC